MKLALCPRCGTPTPGSACPACAVGRPGVAVESSGGVAIEVVGPGGMPEPAAPLNDAALASIAALPGVTAVIPQDYFQAGATIKLNRLEGGGSILGAGTEDLANLGVTAEQGTTELLPGTVIVGSQVAANFYDPRLRPGQEPPAPPDLYDQTLTIQLMKWMEDGTVVTKDVRARVVGVLVDGRLPGLTTSTATPPPESVETPG